MRDLVAALREVAAALRLNAQPTPPDPTYMAVIREQTEALRKNYEMQQEQMARRIEWERVEREHMQECAERYRRQQPGQPLSTAPIKH